MHYRMLLREGLQNLLSVLKFELFLDTWKPLKVKRWDKAIATRWENSEFAAQYPRIRSKNLEVMLYFIFMHYIFKKVIAALPLFTLLGGGYFIRCASPQP